MHGPPLHQGYGERITIEDLVSDGFTSLDVGVFSGHEVADIPSGKRLQNYGKSPFLMGKSTINGHVQ